MSIDTTTCDTGSDLIVGSLVEGIGGRIGTVREITQRGPLGPIAVRVDWEGGTVTTLPTYSLFWGAAVRGTVR
jgi:hypothetical protein